LARGPRAQKAPRGAKPQSRATTAIDYGCNNIVEDAEKIAYSFTPLSFDSKALYMVATPNQRIDVVMPIGPGDQEWAGEAIESILNQVNVDVRLILVLD